MEEAGNRFFACFEYKLLLTHFFFWPISCRMDVTRDDLALELRLWLGGKIVEHSCLPVTVRVEEGVSRFVKFGKAPLQSDLILWLLSRSQLNISEVDNSVHTELVFGGSEKIIEKLQSAENTSTVQNTYAKTVRAASLHETFNRSEKDRVLDSMLERSHSITDDLLYLNDKHSIARSTGYVDDLGMYEATHQILGRSAALSLATQDRIKGRPDAKPVVNTLHMSATNAQLVADLKTARKKIEQSMDIRRQVLPPSSFGWTNIRSYNLLHSILKKNLHSFLYCFLYRLFFITVYQFNNSDHRSREDSSGSGGGSLSHHPRRSEARQVRSGRAERAARLAEGAARCGGGHHPPEVQGSERGAAGGLDVGTERICEPSRAVSARPSYRNGSFATARHDLTEGSASGESAFPVLLGLRRSQTRPAQ